MDLKKVPVGILGGGAMAENIIRGILKAKLFSKEQVTVTDIHPERLKHLSKTFKITTTADNKKTVSHSDIIIMAVKPQSIQGLLQEITPAAKKNQLFISIAAGIKTVTISRGLSGKGSIIRVMPNIAARMLESASALCTGPNAGEKALRIAERIFATIGKTVVVDEHLMDAVTGLSGSGPAYVFLFIEAMADAGVKLGLTRKTALLLAAQTCFGASKLLIDTEELPAKLKDQVTSPAGTTIYGLHVLEQGGLRGLLMEAIEKATQRSQALGK